MTPSIGDRSQGHGTALAVKLRAQRWYALACLVCAACASSTPADETSPDSTGGVHVSFEPGQGAALSFGAIPWPDDLYLNRQSQIMLGDLPGSPLTDYTRALRSSLAELDGFGIGTPVFFYMNGAIDPDTLPQTAADSMLDDASVFLIDADTGSPQAFQRIAVEVNWSGDQKRLALRPAPGHPLTPGRRYAALVTRRVKDSGGMALVPAEKFAAVRDTSAVITDTRLSQARAEYTPVLETLSKLGTLRDEIVAMAVFRVQTAQPDLEAARRLLRLPPVPANLQAIDAAGLDKLFGGASAPDTRAAHDRLLGIIQGTFSTPNFVADSARVHGSWQRDSNGELKIRRMEDVPFTLFVPKGDQPAPLVIYQHQRGRERSDAVVIANVLAERNIAVIAIDAPFQGMRAKSEGRGLDWRNRFTGAETPDGFGDLSGDFYGSADNQGALLPLHPFYVRDALRQGVVDLMNVVHFLGDGDFAPLVALGEVGKRTFDSRRIGFVGEDIGAQLGLVLASVEPKVATLALSGAGASVAQGFWLSARDQGSFVQLAELIGRDAATVDYVQDSPAYWPELALFETLLGRGEPLAFTPSLLRAPLNVALFMAQDDEVVANSGTEALAIALGASVLGRKARYQDELSTQEAVSGDVIAGNFSLEGAQVTRSLSVYEPADHGFLLSTQGAHHFAAPVEPPFRGRTDTQSFANPSASATAALAQYFASFFACVDNAPAGVTVSASPCSADVTTP